MKFTFERDSLIKEIAIAQEIISTKNAGSILSNVLLDAHNNTLTIKACDVKINFETQIPVQIESEGTTTVYCDKLMGILNTLPAGEIEFIQDIDSSKVIIKPILIKNKFEIKSMSQEKFPDLASFENVPYFEISSKDIKEMIRQTVFAVSNDETRYYLNGVYFEKKGDNLNLVATDGRRLSFISKSILAGINDFPAAIIYPKILNIVLKHAPDEGNIFIAVIDKMIFFKFGNYKFGSVLIDGEFPVYSRAIPESQAHSFQVNREELLNALKRVSLMVDKKGGRVFFNISSGTLNITSNQSELGSAEEEIPCMYDGDFYSIAMNIAYIEEPLKEMDTERVTFEFTEEMKAVTLLSEPVADFKHIIMPMQHE